MQVINTRPPNFAAVVAVFPMAIRPGVVFTYGDILYNPGGVDIPLSLMEHEEVHAARQKVYPGGPDAWWSRYLEDVQFRFDEELPAHQAEYRRLVASMPNRKMRRGALKQVATRLSGPLYGRMISLNKAMEAIAAE